MDLGEILGEREILDARSQARQKSSSDSFLGRQSAQTKISLSCRMRKRSCRCVYVCQAPLHKNLPYTIPARDTNTSSKHSLTYA